MLVYLIFPIFKMKERFMMADNKKADKKAKNTEAKVEGAADVGVETPVDEGPAYPEGVSMQALPNDAFAFAPIDPSLTPAQRQDRVLQLLDATKSAEGRLDFIQGELLYEASKNGYWKTWTTQDPSTGVSRPFNSWEEFVETRLGLKRRTSFTRIDLYTTYVIKLKVPPEELKEIDLSKAALVTKIVTEDNWPAVSDAIKTMSWTQVADFVKNAKSAASIADAVTATMAPKALPGPAGTEAEAPSGGAATKDGSGVKTFSVKLEVAQYDNVKAAIQVVKTATGMDSDSMALDVIATEYLASSSAGMKKQEIVSRLISNIEATYGVGLKVESVPDDWDEGGSDE